MINYQWYFFFLEKIRKLFKSIGKKEIKINDLITYKKFQKIKNKITINLENFNPNNANIEDFKIVASIAFFYDEKKVPFFFGQRFLFLCNRHKKKAQKPLIIYVLL